MPEAQKRVRIKRAYEKPSESDGHRVLVDRIWPRGISKEKLHLDDWAKEVAPSSELRKWFNHERSKWDEFRKRYFEELDQKADVVEGLLPRGKGAVTFVFGAADTEYNNAVALREYVERCADRDRHDAS